MSLFYFNKSDYAPEINHFHEKCKTAVFALCGLETPVTFNLTGLCVTSDLHVTGPAGMAPGRSY